jgi:hypothetical protein
VFGVVSVVVERMKLGAVVERMRLCVVVERRRLCVVERRGLFAAEVGVERSEVGGGHE